MSRDSRWKYIRKMAWDRDRKNHAVCGICGQPIDYMLEPSSCDAAYEPDHIIPVSKDKTKELFLENIRASHRSCNRNRGTANGIDTALGPQSRLW